MESATISSLTDFWRSLPEELKVRLRFGFTGKQHLLDIAGWCLRSGNAEWTPIAVGAIQTAFAQNPINGELAGELIQHDHIRTLLPPETLEALVAVATSWTHPGNTGYFERLLAQRDLTKLKIYIERSAEKEPDNLYWREQAVTFGLVDNDPTWVLSMLDFSYPVSLAPVMVNLLASIEAFRGNHAQAARMVRDTGMVFGAAHPLLTAGVSMLREGDKGAANLLLVDAVVRAPWNTSLLLRVHDLLCGRDDLVCSLNGTTAVLLYSWNKDVELDATLASLHASDLEGASVYILNNGSTDATPKILNSWRERFTRRLGVNRFEVLTLPVNVGAPAARNWLMHHPPVTAHDFICYLDDDIILPSDWLQRFGAAVAAYPEAGVWGCKVVDHANPALVQSADSHLVVDEDGDVDLSRIAPNPFRLTNLHIQSLDAGLFDTMRPCASVTGCCHLFRREVLLEAGDFAIHLSPSQYDDMEHDLRLCESGRFAVCQGHLTVRHRKRTGAASHTSMQEEGNALGNKYKMQTMHEREVVRSAMQAEQELLEDDILAKLGVLDTALSR